MYDDWQNGGNRTTAQRHNIVAILTEAASVRLASPIFQSKDQLRGGVRGLSEYRQAVNFPDPWPGGWWRLRDIVDYELIISRSLLTLAARYRESFQGNLVAIASEAVNTGTTTPPFAWVIPPFQRDPGAAVALIRILHGSGIEVQKAGLRPFPGRRSQFSRRDVGVACGPTVSCPRERCARAPGLSHPARCRRAPGAPLRRRRLDPAAADGGPGR